MACGNKRKMQNAKCKTKNTKILILSFSFALCVLLFIPSGFSQDIKLPNVAGTFYPDNPGELSSMIDAFIDKANPVYTGGDIFALISPHAGYGFSGQTAAFGYKLIKGKKYHTVIIIAPSHYYGFSGVSIYPEGVFRTPLGDLEIDKEFTQKLLNKDMDIIFDPLAFAKEHSLEVQLPFLQKTIDGKNDFKIVPIVMGDVTLKVCQKLADLLKEAIEERRDILLIVSSDMYHGYDYEEADIIDNLTLGYLKNMDAEGLYYGLREGKVQLCGGFPAVTAIILAKQLGHNKLTILKHTNSGEVTGKKIKGIWTVGYASCVIDNLPLGYQAEEEGALSLTGKAKGDDKMLSKEQRKRLLEIARASIETYLKTGSKMEIAETDPVLTKEMGAFVTLHEHGELRGCIGNLIGSQPLYLTIRDMAVEAAVGDPRFSPVKLSELKDIEIEISVLSPLERVKSSGDIQMGIHGVLIRRGFRSGVFLPQVATETGWSKEEFLSNLCMHKAGLSKDAWKDPDTEIYIFTAEVFSEKDY